MATFSKVLIYSTSISRAGLVAAEPSSRALNAMTRQIHKALLESADAMTTMLAIESHGPLTAVWGPCGQTAGVVIWVRGSELQAVSVIAAGLDREEDARAIAVAAHTCAIHSWDDSTSARLAMAQRPLLATLHGPVTTVTDPVLATASTAWAMAFFGMLGVDQEKIMPLPP